MVDSYQLCDQIACWVVTGNQPCGFIFAPIICQHHLFFRSKSIDDMTSWGEKWNNITIIAWKNPNRFLKTINVSGRRNT